MSSPKLLYSDKVFHAPLSLGHEIEPDNNISD